MNTDFRVSVDFFGHHKTKKLQRRIGDAGVMSLLRLWAYVAKIKPDGDIASMDTEDIEIAADWKGECGAFVKAAIESGFFEEYEGEYYLHDWKIHNPWVSDCAFREDEARFSALRRWNPEAARLLESQGVSAISKEDYEQYKRGGNAALTPSQWVSNANPMGSHCEPIGFSNAPSTSPLPSPEPRPKNQGQNIIAAPPPDTAFAGDESPKAKAGPQGVSREERDMLRILSEAKGGYKYDYAKDLSQLRTLSVEFPSVDMLEEAKKMAAWLIDKPDGKVKNPRAFMRNWIANAAKRASPRASPPAVRRDSRGVPDLDDIQRRFDEKYGNAKTGGDVIDV
jgi:hypothetical protein